MKLSKLTKPELEEIFRNANFTEEEEKVFKMLSCGKTITETAQKINVCERTGLIVIQDSIPAILDKCKS